MNSIAANIYDSLKENGNVHDVLKFMSLQDDKSSVVKNLAQAIKDSLKGTYLTWSEPGSKFEVCRSVFGLVVFCYFCLSL